MAVSQSHREQTVSQPERVQDVMTSQPLTISPDTPVHEAQQLMRQHRIAHLLVCEAGRLVGMLSDRDLQRVLPSPATSLSVYEQHYLLDRLTAGEIMERFPVTIGPEHALTEAVRRMLSHNIDALPVTENRRVVGLLTRTHLLRLLLRPQMTCALAA